MASKFELQFKKSNKEVFADRGSRVGKQMENSSTSFIKTLKDKIFSAEMEIEEMMDFSKTNTTSLDVKRPESYDSYVRNLNEKKMNLAVLQEELRIAEDTHNEFFADTEKEEKEND